MEIKIKRRPGGPIEKTRKELERIEPLVEKLAVDAVSFSTGAFDRQGLHKAGTWKKKQNPNFAGIYADANKGITIKRKHFQQGPALMQTKRLKKSIRYEKPVREGFKLYSTAPYADIHQEGKTSTQKMAYPNIFRKTIFKAIDQFKDVLTRKQIKQLIGLTKKRIFKVKVNKREFLGYDLKRASKIVHEHFREVWRRG